MVLKDFYGLPQSELLNSEDFIRFYARSSWLARCGESADIIACRKLVGVDGVAQIEKQIEHFKQRSFYLETRIGYMMTFENRHPFFITLTFNDSTLSNTSPDTRRRYVNRFCNSLFEHYVANIDFGTEKGREHYHVIGLGYENITKLDCSSWDCYGFSNCKIVKKNKDSKKSLSKYIQKLKNHAKKESTKGIRPIYSRSSISPFFMRYYWYEYIGAFDNEFYLQHLSWRFIGQYRLLHNL